MGDLEVFSSDGSVPKLESNLSRAERKIKLYCWYSMSHRQKIEYQVKLSVYPKNAFFFEVRFAKLSSQFFDCVDGNFCVFDKRDTLIKIRVF